MNKRLIEALSLNALYNLFPFALWIGSVYFEMPVMATIATTWMIVFTIAIVIGSIAIWFVHSTKERMASLSRTQLSSVQLGLVTNTMYAILNIAATAHANAVAGAIVVFVLWTVELFIGASIANAIKQQQNSTNVQK